MHFHTIDNSILWKWAFYTPSAIQRCYKKGSWCVHNMQTSAKLMKVGGMHKWSRWKCWRIPIISEKTQRPEKNQQCAEKVLNSTENNRTSAKEHNMKSKIVLDNNTGLSNIYLGRNSQVHGDISGFCIKVFVGLR